MKKVILNQFQLWWYTGVWGMALLAAAFLIGVLLMTAVYHFFGSENGMVFGMGFFFGGILGVVYVLMVSYLRYGRDFNLELSLNCTRKRFFWSALAVTAAENLLLSALLLLLSEGEAAWYAARYPKAPLWNPVSGIWLWYFFAAACLVSAVGALAGVLIRRFGSRVQILFWTLWMIFVLTLPRSLPAEPTDATWAGRCLKALSGLSPLAWIGMAGILTAAFYGAVRTLSRKWQVM